MYFVLLKNTEEKEHSPDCLDINTQKHSTSNVKTNQYLTSSNITGGRSHDPAGMTDSIPKSAESSAGNHVKERPTSDQLMWFTHEAALLCCRTVRIICFNWLYWGECAPGTTLTSCTVSECVCVWVCEYVTGEHQCGMNRLLFPARTGNPHGNDNKTVIN